MSKGKKRTPGIVRQEVQDYLNKALDCLKAARDAMHELPALYAAEMSTQQEPAKPEKPVQAAKAQKAVKQPAKKPAAPAKATKASKPAKTTAAPTDIQADRESEKKSDDAVRASSGRMAPHELTLNIGSQPVKELAENDAKDLLANPKVFWYRPIQFPDPKRYHVQPRILSAKVVERKSPKFTRAPWTVSVTLEALGDDKRCANWLKAVLAKNKADQE